MANRFYDFWRQFGQKTWRRLEEKPDALARAAWELVNGRLPELPDHIVLSARLEYLSERVLAHAISPTGKIAILMARDEMTCGLITWSQEEGLRKQNLDNLWHYTEELPMGVLFPHGSEDPLVYYGEDHEDGDRHNIRWKDFHYQIPRAQSKLHNVDAWVAHDARHIVLSTSDGWIYFRKGDQEREWQTKHSEHWMGCIDGQFAEIRSANSGQRLHWHGGEVSMPDESHVIQTRTIRSAPNVGIWFVSHDGEHPYIWWAKNNGKIICTPVPGKHIDRHGILLICRNTRQVFVENAFHPLKMHDHLLFAGNESEGVLTSGAIWDEIMTPGTDCYNKLHKNRTRRRQTGPVTKGKISRRALLLTSNAGDELLVYALASGVRTEVFPMHGDYFHTLGVVRKGNRVYILGFHLVGSTLHIIRYPIV